MESTQNILHEAERAAAAPFLNEPRSPWWYPLLTGAFFTGLAAGPLLIAHGYAPLGFVLQAAAVCAYSAFMLGHRRRAGTSPRLRRAPREVRGAYWWLGGATVVCAAVTIACWVSMGWQAGLPSLFLSSAAATWWYERRAYPRAVAATQERLG